MTGFSCLLFVIDCILKVWWMLLWDGSVHRMNYAAPRHTDWPYIDWFAIRVGYCRVVRELVTVPGPRWDLVWLQTSDLHTLPLTGFNLPACRLLVPSTCTDGRGNLQAREWQIWTHCSTPLAWGLLTFDRGRINRTVGRWRIGVWRCGAFIQSKGLNAPQLGFNSVCVPS